MKIWQDDGELWFGSATTFPPIPTDVFREIVEAAHRVGMRVYVHAWRAEYAREAVLCGVTLNHEERSPPCA